MGFSLIKNRVPHGSGRLCPPGYTFYSRSCTSTYKFWMAQVGWLFSGWTVSFWRHGNWTRGARFLIKEKSHSTILPLDSRKHESVQIQGLILTIGPRSLGVIVNRNHFTTKNLIKTLNGLCFNSITFKKEISWKLENYVPKKRWREVTKRGVRPFSSWRSTLHRASIICFVWQLFDSSKTYHTRVVSWTTAGNTMLSGNYLEFLAGDR